MSRRCARGSGVHVWLLFLVTLGAAAPPPSAGQSPDIEAVAAMRGIPLPASYWAQVRDDVRAFEFERALYNRVSSQTAARGQVRIPVVLALFRDSSDPIQATRDDVQRALFDGPSSRGTITESYLEMSRGALRVDGDVFGWTRSSLSLAEVVPPGGLPSNDDRIGEFIVEALAVLDPEIDFTLYDNDGPDGIADSGDDDGFVDILTFEYLEVAASCGGPGIWPHRSTLTRRNGSAYVTDDVGIDGEPIRILDYLTQSATDCTGQNVQDAAVITHEFGHALGLPDFYHWIDTSAGPYGRRWVLGCWALMAAGSWGCGPVTDDRKAFGPTHMIGFSKDYLGWIDFADPGEVWNETIELSPIEISGEALKIPLDDIADEYLIVEFRDTIGFDRDLPGRGVLMYKQDIDAFLRPDPASNDPYFLTMLEADDNRSLVRTALEGGSRGEIGDAWGVGTGTGLHALSAPGLRLDDGGWTTVQVHEVSVEGDRARIVLSTGRTPKLVEPGGAFDVAPVRSFRAPVRVAGGRGPYQVAGTLPDGFTLEPGGDELVLIGSVRTGESTEVSFAARDSNGAVTNTVTVVVRASGEWTVEIASLVQTFLDSPAAPLSAGEMKYLDELGNANGQYDVGDLRKWLRETR